MLLGLISMRLHEPWPPKILRQFLDWAVRGQVEKSEMATNSL